MSTYNLTKGSVWKNLIRFSLPYLLSCFLQTFYGMADLFITGQFNGASTITAVSVGSQLMHMLTVIIVGLAMGSTVMLSRSVGAKDQKTTAKAIGNSVILFSVFALLMTTILLLSVNGILGLLSVPSEAWRETKNYVVICFIGVIFITAYNVLSSMYRGLGDSRHPMYFVMLAGILNVGMDYLLIGPFHMGAAGAAVATVLSQAVSVLLAILFIPRMLDIRLKRSDFQVDGAVMGRLLRVGVPVAAQDGLIQVSFLVITMIANRRGVDVAAAVGIVEKVISFLFLVPSAMLSSVSTLCAQNIGAGEYRRSRSTLYDAVAISVGAGILFTVICRLFAPQILQLFTREEPEVVRLGAQYLRAYVLDCIFAGVHFCFSGYFCACEKPILSFIHNIASIILLRIPVAYFASVRYPDNLFPMGLAAPLGSLLSAVICIAAFWILERKRILEDRRG